MTDLDRRWLTVAAAATATGRSVRTIERWIADQRLAAVTVGGVRYVRELALLEVERATRRAHHGARPRTVLARLDTDVVSSRHSGLPPAPERSP